MLKHGVIALTAVGLLVGCTTASLKELRQTSLQGSPHSIELAKAYLAFSEQEAAQYDWVDSQYFAEKGLQAAYGKSVAPESPMDWEIEPSLLPEFKTGHEKLAQWLTEEHTANHPALTAKAQVAYDCWLEQQEEGWQMQAIEGCKETFYGLLGQLEGKMPAAEEVMVEPTETMDVAEEEEEPQLIRSTAYIVFFDHGQANLTPLAEDVLARVLDDLKKYPDTHVLLHGHADRSGTNDYNMQLSMERAESVRAALTYNGVSEEQIQYFAFGETDLRVNTEDGIKEPANRRVEIFLE
jgi:OOP family OmpA-OmpF porin